MKLIRIISLIITFIILSTPLVTKADAGKTRFVEAYKIGCGDRLLISAWKEEALTRNVGVLPDGTIHFPLVGEIMANGKTVKRLRKELKKKLVPYMPGIDLHIEIQQVNSFSIYVIGKVNSPGRFQLYSSIDVMKALAMARGLNAYADKDEIKIFRKTKSGQKILPFDYNEVLQGENPEQNIPLKAGDLIVVP